jgi:hypothetical protein
MLKGGLILAYWVLAFLSMQPLRLEDAGVSLSFLFVFIIGA